MAWDRVSLADAMIARMDRDEVEDLCFRLAVDDESLDGKTKNSLVRSLIKYMEQREQFDLLAGTLAEMRPDMKPPIQPPAPAPPAGEVAPIRAPATSASVSSDAGVDVVPPPPATELAGAKPGDQMTDPMGVIMVYVPRGTFRMGGWGGDTGDKVAIVSDFWLDLMPVTNAMYTQFVNAGGYTRPEFWSTVGWKWVLENQRHGPHDYEDFTDPGQPRVGVTWFEAYAYCRWRGGRLPTEAEWEWAARGPDNRMYPWGNEWDASHVVCRDNSGGKTAFVDAHTRLNGASWVGAVDLSGNVYEWTSSLGWSYPYNPGDGRETPEDAQNGPDHSAATDSARALRGGSWNAGEWDLPANSRIRFDPATETNDAGFRCARSAT